MVDLLESRIGQAVGFIRNAMEKQVQKLHLLSDGGETNVAV